MNLKPMSTEQVIDSVGKEAMVITTGAVYGEFARAAERLGASALWYSGRAPSKGEIYKIINYISDTTFHYACLVLIGNSKGEFVIGAEGLHLLQKSKVKSIW